MNPSLHAAHLRILNQVFELEKKIQRSTENATMQRPIDRIKDTFSELGYRMHNPVGEMYDETRTDLEASIVGEATAQLVVTDTIKPIVFLQEDGRTSILQKGIVLVAKKPTDKNG